MILYFSLLCTHFTYLLSALSFSQGTPYLHVPFLEICCFEILAWLEDQQHRQ
jgi:hypothetical protein